jgi:hypothetical protein
MIGIVFKVHLAIKSQIFGEYIAKIPICFYKDTLGFFSSNQTQNNLHSRNLRILDYAFNEDRERFLLDKSPCFLTKAISL